MTDLTPEIVTALLDAGRLGMGPQSVPGGNVPYVLVPEGAKVQIVPELIYNEHTAKPERIKQRLTVLDPGSFNQYYTLFNDPNSRVFADESTLKVLAVLDYHGAAEGGPRWGSHRLTLTFRQSEEWKIWTGANNKKMTQQEFAEFLEQNSLDVTKPAPADMMEIASDLQATTAVEFGSGLRQQDGQVRFKYTEILNATVGSGQVIVPERFTISMPAFIGGDRVDMDALLRFRVNQGKLTFWYTLVRPEEVIRAAFITARGFIATTLGITIINGSPE
jgi:uncharacterized protein YfdQ (DUF2303 family)